MKLGYVIPISLLTRLHVSIISVSYTHLYSDEELLRFANEVWEEINLPNLERNILPTRFRADLILEKSEHHCVRGVRIRKI